MFGSVTGVRSLVSPHLLASHANADDDGGCILVGTCCGGLQLSSACRDTPDARIPTHIFRALHSHLFRGDFRRSVDDDH